MKKIIYIFLLFSGLSFSQSSITWTNAPASPITFSPGESIEMNLSYTSPDVDYICVWIREVDAAGNKVSEYGAFSTCALSGGDDTHANSDSIVYNYTIPANVPESSTLALGNYYSLIIFMSNDGGGFANGSRDIVISTTTNKAKVTAILNAKHTVGGADTFRRDKFINIHASQTENEWNGDNFVSDLKDEFLNGYDVYMGRNTGGITWNLNQLNEDSSRPGYADPNSITSKGLNSRNSYANQTNLHQYEARNKLILAGQKYPFWTGAGQVATGKGWMLANATATGEYMGRYINAFHGGNGQPLPAFVEVINEPAYSHHGGPENYTNTLEDVANFHKDAAIAIKAQAANTKVGGYTTAFPNFEKGDFQRWNNRWKLFMDIAGDDMDFWSIHLYDFASINNGQKKLRSGSNVEATFDMMEQYSQMKFNKVKPFVISEYGAQMHDYQNQPWSPYRDWLHLKAQNAQLMSFLERPNTILSALNFLIVKAEWGYSNGYPYHHRLMRKENEPDSYTGQWVYTDMVKFYQLWKNVNGTRIDTKSDNLDVQVDGYVDGDKAYIILNNLNFVNEEVNLSLIELKGLTLNSIQKKHLFLNGNNVPEFLDESIPVNTSSVTLNAESTMILEYTFANQIVVDETNTETKHYATSYLKPISSNQAEVFQINGISKNSYGEALLRIGIGRQHGLSLQPIVKVNGTSINVPSNWRGDNQEKRERFFGALEIPVDFSLLQTNNTISVEFPDNGGHISTTTLQVFNFSSDLRSATLSVNDNSINKKTWIYPNPTKGVFHISDISNIKRVKIYNITGAEVKSFEATKSFDISDLPSGIYFLKADNGMVKKIIKQ